LEKNSEEWLKIRCQAVQGRRLGSERIIQGIIDLAGNEYLTEPENKVKGKMDYWPGTLFILYSFLTEPGSKVKGKMDN
jgi:hypothetical protein